ncbi:MAG: P-II family nitrogen regulator [Thermoguttaceae bacterium]
MKMIIAVLPPDRLEKIKKELADVNVFRLTVMDVQGFGAAKISPDLGKGRESEMMQTRRVQIMIGVNDNFLEPTLEAIRKGAYDHDTTPDGKIFVLPLEECVRIRTGERGNEAI